MLLMSAATSVHTYARRQPVLLLHTREHVAPERVSDWARVHDRIVALRTERAAHEREVCRWLLAAERLGVHVRAGYASLREYSDRTLGLSGRETEERLRVGRALAGLPALDRALASGELCWSAVRELTRVATRETEEAWVDWAKHRRVRQIEDAVASRRPGDEPRDRSDPTLVEHRLAFKVRAETMALFRDLQAAVRADLGGEADEDTVLYEIARRALGGPGEEGRAGYQVAVSRCDECGRTSIDAGGVSHAVDEVIAEMMECDNQRIEVASPHMGAPSRATQSIPPAIRREVARRDHNRCIVPGCQNHLFLDAHHLDPRCEGGGHDPERVGMLCGAHHRAVHLGHLCIDGTAGAGFSFRHADGSPYGAQLRPLAIDAATHVFGALQNLGFRQTRARELVDAVLRDGAPDDPAAFLKAALRAS
jgi:hypothetical protein